MSCRSESTKAGVASGVHGSAGAFGGSQSTFRSRRAWIVFLTAIVLSLVVDLLTKEWAFARLADAPVTIDRSQVLATSDLHLLLPQPPPRVVVVPGLLDLTLVLNPGAVFGLGAGKRWFFIFFTVIAVAVVTWIFWKGTRPRDWPAHLAAGLIIGSGLGNLYDRVLYACVRDFLHPLPQARWPGGKPLWPYVSNVADALLLAGIAGLLLFTWRRDASEDMPAGPKTNKDRAES
ncbi:MAG: signal peptidase II [Phycisphaeraceae bacterium]|nr:signal peptidase II [Phycisphaeraceae bacterium]